MASLTKKKVVCLISLIFIMGLPTDVRSISDDNDFGGGFFGSLESMANTVGGYLRSATPYLKEGLQMAQRAEQWVDSVIAEECLYTCKNNRHVPVAKPGHVASSNGCGSAASGIFDHTETSLIKVERGFTKCCNRHDLCYDTCNSDKDLCDIEFKKCLYSVCRSDSNKLSFIDGKTCKLKAKLFFVTVIGVGCQAYLDAQANACVCRSLTEQKQSSYSQKNYQKNEL